MAPRKKTTTVKPSDRVTRSSARVTRSGTRQAKLDPISPPLKKHKKSPKQPKAKKENPSSSSVSVEKEVAEAEDEAEADTKVADGDVPKKTIIVEHCKQCNSFKNKALHVKKGLEEGLDGLITVVLNPEKPRKGCFEIREDGEDGETFLSLLDMKRPFTPMKDLDLDQVVSDIINKIKA